MKRMTKDEADKAADEIIKQFRNEGMSELKMALVVKVSMTLLTLNLSEDMDVEALSDVISLMCAACRIEGWDIEEINDYSNRLIDVFCATRGMPNDSVHRLQVVDLGRAQ